MTHTRETIQRTALREESRAVQVAVGSGLVAALVSFLAFWGDDVALWGGVSMGLIAAIVGAICGTASFVWGYLSSLGPVPPRTVDTLGRARRVLDTSALALNHVAIWLLLSLVAFVTLQQAFLGLTVDTLSAAIIVSVAVAVASYFMFASGTSITAFRVSSLLSIFIVSGVLSSMISADDPEWWKMNFSALGTMSGFSGFAFNFTLIGAGALIMTLADYMTADLKRWASTRPDYDSRRVSAVGWALFALGASLAGVGTFPVDDYLALHNTFAISMVLMFLALVIALRFLLPGFSATFIALGYGFLVAIVVVTILFFPVGYYNLTALELVAAAVIFGWIVILIRTIAAATEDAREGTTATLR